MTEGSRSDGDDAEFTHEPVATGAASGRDATDRTDPLDDLAAAVERDTDRSQSSAPDFDDLFDRQEAADIDGDRLWSQLEADEPTEMPVPTDREIREIDKRSYCQGCEFFAEPPDVACTHEDAEILTVPTTETFRVADCPFVREDEALEGSD